MPAGIELRSRARRPALDGGNRIRWWLAIVGAIVVVATAGYMTLPGWSLSDSLYMTVITITTVGFREVHELDTTGQLWTMLVAIGGAGIIFGGVGVVTERLVTDVTSGKREARRMTQAIDGMSGHFIVCGYGRVGSTVARELVHAGERPVVIDVNPDSIEAARASGHFVVAGNATQDSTLRAAGIERARGLITVIDSDVDNVYVALSARALNPDLFIVARAGEEDTESKLLQAGADRVVSPYTRAGRHIAELAIRPRVADFIDTALSHGDLAFSLEEVRVAAAGPLDGRTVGDLRTDGIHVLAVVRGDHDYEANPPADRRLAPGDSLVVSGAAEPLARLRDQV